MMKIFLFGINGKMGKMICESAGNFPGVEICGGFDLNKTSAYKVFDNVDAVDIPFDVIVDFSRPEALDNIIKLAEKFKKPVVFATTGYDENALKKIEALSKKVAVFRSGNMSLGVNTVIELVERATEILFDRFDVEIIEKHHNQKVDSPSGTAKMLADAVNKAADEKAAFVYGREGKDTLRKKNDVGIHAVRGGTIIGEHEVMFCGNDEIVTISHTALSRKIFADGAINAAIYMNGKKTGMYNMKNVLG